MTELRRWFVGVDWASKAHLVCLHDDRGCAVGKRQFAPGGAGLAEMVQWLLATTKDSLRGELERGGPRRG